MSGQRPDSEGAEEYGLDRTNEGRLWAEIHNLRRAVEEFPKLLAAELARMRDAREEKDIKVEDRLRAMEIKQAESGVKLMFIGVIAGLIGTGIVEGAVLLFHH